MGHQGTTPPGFAMLGALTVLPTVMQFADGVSATTSGLRTLPMVAGVLITPIGSRNIVGRTGRYKMFAIAGTGCWCRGTGRMTDHNWPRQAEGQN